MLRPTKRPSASRLLTFVLKKSRRLRDLDMSQKEPSNVEDEYNNAVGVANIEQVLLTESKFESKPEYFTADEGEKNFKKSDSIKSFSINDRGDFCASEIEYSVQIKRGNSILLRVEASYIVIFKFDTPVDEGVARKIVSRIGRYAAYPFFRQHVAQISWESGSDLPILPMIRQSHKFSKK
jgi:hypothetical protein